MICDHKSAPGVFFFFLKIGCMFCVVLVSDFLPDSICCVQPDTASVKNRLTAFLFSLGRVVIRSYDPETCCTGSSGITSIVENGQD